MPVIKCHRRLKELPATYTNCLAYRFCRKKRVEGFVIDFESYITLFVIAIIYCELNTK